MKILFSMLLFVSFMFASVNINSANQKDFASLNGIGDKKAVAIVAFRKANGCFKSIDDLVKVKGIGQKIIDKNRDNLTLGKCLK